LFRNSLELQPLNSSTSHSATSHASTTDPVLTVAYLANQFPAAVEPYVGEEIEELRGRGVPVIPGSARKPHGAQRWSFSAALEPEILCLQPVRMLTLLQAFVLAVRRWKLLAGLVRRVFMRGKESPKRRLKALLHTWLGAYYAVLLRERGVNHVHVHHGYFGSWIAMVAARLLSASFSVTLHGSDLLLNGAYLDTKLGNCRFCVTVSEYNRRHILKHFPAVDPGKIIVSRLGVDVPQRAEFSRRVERGPRPTITLVAVGRLHAVKDHAFLVQACARLRDGGLDFECLIAGEGPERRRLEMLIRENRMQHQLILLGHVARAQMGALYGRADLVVLTSRSEGIPLVLMEAMVRGRVVLAPAITGIPELVIPGKTGFLYAPGVLQDLVAKILFLQKLMCGEKHKAVSRLDWIRHAARIQVLHNFNRRKNLSHFGDRFLQLITTQDCTGPDSANPDSSSPDSANPNQDFTNQNWSPPHEDFVLQQI
jgi:colanic acid/amylovoran biosynthesis glycosyltransferase